MNKLSLTTIAVIAASSSLNLSGLIAHATTTTPAAEIVITAKGQQTLANIAATAHVITAADIEASSAPDITALLNDVSGVSVRNSGTRGSASGVFVRGSAGSQIVVLIDGIRSGSPTLGATELTHLPIEAIGRIEIIKGPLSGLYGADAIGGVIQIFTKQFTKKSAETGNGSLSLTAGSNGLQKGVFNLETGNTRNHFRVTLGREETDGIDSTSIASGGNEDDDRFEASNVNVAGQFALSNNTMARISHLQTDNEVAFDNTFGDDTGFLSDNRIKNTAITLDSAWSESLRWTSHLGKQTDEAVTEAFASNIHGERLSFNSQIEKKWSDQQTITIGADVYDEKVTSNTEFPVNQRDNQGLFAQYQQHDDTLGVVANVRFDNNSAYGNDTNGSIAVTSQVSDNSRLTVSYGTAFRAPTFNDLYFPNFGNPDILPEESESLEISLRGTTANAQWRISAFNTDVKNLIGFDPVSFTAANTTNASLKGIEFEVNTYLKGWHLAANLDFLSAEDDSTGLELDDRVETTLNVSASKKWGLWNTRIALLAEDGRHDLSGTELNSFAKVDLSGSYALTHDIKIHAGINNVFDKDYTTNLINDTERFNTEGRTFRLNANYSF